MSKALQIIDVDAPVVVDLTIPPDSIDLTGDDIEELCRPQRPHPTRTKIDYSLQPTRSPAGPPSSIKLNHKQLPSSTLNTSHVPEPPAKKRKTEAPSIVIDVDSPIIKQPSPSPVPVKGKSRAVKRVLELDSDGEDVAMKPKKIKREGSTSSDEDAYARWHAGYDLNNEAIWKPPKVNGSKMTFDVAETFQNLTVSDPSSPPKRQPYHPDFSDPRWHPYTKRPTWKQPPGYVYPPRPRPIQSLHPAQLHRWSQRNVVQPMRLVTSFKTSPGSINQIQQLGSLVALCSATAGGEAGAEHDRYNKEGALIAWDNKVQILPGHSRTWSTHEKHYTINDVKFDRNSKSIISSGNDKSLHIWPYDESENLYDTENCVKWRYNHVPHDLAFKPGEKETALAVAERTLLVYSDISMTAAVSSLSLFQQRARHNVGAMAWGCGPTASYLFASSEPEKEDFTGFHKAFDVNQSTMAYTFDESGSGDAMTVTEDGEKLALFTRRETAHSLRIYDIRRGNPAAVLFMGLESFPSKIEGEVGSAAFSSDGIYLALGRNDNHTHVYDSRLLNRLLFDYEHHGPCRVNPGNVFKTKKKVSYGVVQVQWVDRDSIKPFGLVTGGEDGCVRFWDPLLAANDRDNGKILAEMSSDIAAFSLGNRYEGERALVVGDSAGEVSIFDVHPAAFHSLYR